MLRLPPFRYLAPRRLDEAAQMLEEEGDQAMLVAGGTDLYPNMKRRQFTPPVLIGLRALPELKTISGSPHQGMPIGPAVTPPPLPNYPPLLTHYPSLPTS